MDLDAAAEAEEKGNSYMQSRFDSRCKACGDKIYEGDEIVRDDDIDAWVHEDCGEAPFVAPKKVKVKKGPSLADKLRGDDPDEPAPPPKKASEKCVAKGCNSMAVGALTLSKAGETFEHIPFCDEHRTPLGRAMAGALARGQ